MSKCLIIGNHMSRLKCFNRSVLLCSYRFMVKIRKMPMSPRKQRSVSHEDSTAQQGTSSTKPLVAKNHCCKLLKGGYHCCLFNFNHRFIDKQKF